VLQLKTLVFEAVMAESKRIERVGVTAYKAEDTYSALLGRLVVAKGDARKRIQEQLKAAKEKFQERVHFIFQRADETTGKVAKGDGLRVMLYL